MEKNFKLYISESPLSSYSLPTFILLFSVFLKSTVIRLLIILSNLFFKEFEVNQVINLIALLCVIIGVGKLFRNIFFRAQYPTLLSLYYWIICGILYYFIRLDQQLYFYSFFSTIFYLADFIIIGALFYFSSYIYLGKTLKSKGELQLIEDSSDKIKISDDKLSRSSYAIHLSQYINNTTCDKAIAISILAQWGSGKTTFLKFVETKLKEESDNIIIHFNPWKFEKSGQILPYFFDELESEFEKFDNHTALKIKAYADKITEIDDSTFTKVLKETINSTIGKEKSITDRYDSLNKSIERLGKRLIVIIDDLDRLLPEEINSVIKLIRNTADFANTFFIVAFDQNFVLSSLSSLRSSNNKENFLQKIFQLEIVLPPINKDTIEELVKDSLGIDSMPEDEKIRFSEALSKNDDFLSLIKASNNNTPISPDIKFLDFLNNIRDIKRFTNTFKFTNFIIGKEVELYDLFTIELIKYRYPTIYNLIAEGKIVKSLLKGGILELDKNYLDQLKNLEIIEPELTRIASVLADLFDKNRVSSDRTIIFEYNFHLYFSYQLLGSISVHDFSNALRNGEVALLEYFNTSIFSNKLSELMKYINHIKAFRTTEEFKNLIHCLFSISDKFDNSQVHQLIILIGRAKNNIEKYFQDEKSYNQYLKELLENNNYNIIIRAQIVYTLLGFHLTNQQIKILTSDYLESLLFNLFKSIIENHPEKEEDIYNLYINIIEPIILSSGKFQNLNENDVNRLMKDYLHGNNRFFLSSSILFWNTFEDDSFRFNEHIPHIFGNYDAFEEFLTKLEESECKKFIIKRFNEFKEKGYKPIIIKDFKNNPCNNNN